jgi:hypothetical protein
MDSAFRSYILSVVQRIVEEYSKRSRKPTLQIDLPLNFGERLEALLFGGAGFHR